MHTTGKWGPSLDVVWLEGLGHAGFLLAPDKQGQILELIVAGGAKDAGVGVGGAPPAAAAPLPAPAILARAAST